MSWGSGANAWGPEKEDKFTKPNHWDGMLEVRFPFKNYFVKKNIISICINSDQLKSTPIHSNPINANQVHLI